MTDEGDGVDPPALVHMWGMTPGFPKVRLRSGDKYPTSRCPNFRRCDRQALIRGDVTCPACLARMRSKW